MAEFSIIERYFKALTTTQIDVGIGDDCAILSPPPQQQLVSCVDTLVAGRHFPLDTSPHAIGWKSIAVNLSDLAAMGATPHSILLALSLPNIDESWLAEFSRGIADCCQKFGVQLIGGDTTQSPTLTISITALGWIETGKGILRSGAQVGDFIAVSGEIGSAAYALQHPNSDLQAALDYPEPQCILGQKLVGYANGMLDISDGLAQDLGHMLKASHVGAELYLEKIPVHPLLRTLDLEEKMQYVLAGGDDYHLCFSISEEKLKQFEQNNTEKIHVIGKITAEKGCQYSYDNQIFHPQKLGYQHFATRSD